MASECVKPALKLFCKQVKDCQPLTSVSGEFDGWAISLRNNSKPAVKEIRHKFHSIWLQGTIIDTINQSSVILKDISNGMVKVTDCDQMPGGSVWIKKGVYCSVIGTIVSSSHTPHIKALKMTSLENFPNLELLWDWEVRDLQNLLAEC